MKTKRTMLGGLACLLIGISVVGCFKKEEYTLQGQKVVYSWNQLDGSEKLSFGDTLDIKADPSGKVNFIRKRDISLWDDQIRNPNNKWVLMSREERTAIINRELSKAQYLYKDWKSKIDSVRIAQLDSAYYLLPSSQQQDIK